MNEPRRQGSVLAASSLVVTLVNTGLNSYPCANEKIEGFRFRSLLLFAKNTSRKERNNTTFGMSGTSQARGLTFVTRLFKDAGIVLGQEAAGLACDTNTETQSNREERFQKSKQNRQTI